MRESALLVLQMCLNCFFFSCLHAVGVNTCTHMLLRVADETLCDEQF